MALFFNILGKSPTFSSEEISIAVFPERCQYSLLRSFHCYAFYLVPFLVSFQFHENRWLVYMLGKLKHFSASWTVQHCVYLCVFNQFSCLVTDNSFPSCMLHSVIGMRLPLLCNKLQHIKSSLFAFIHSSTVSVGLPLNTCVTAHPSLFKKKDYIIALWRYSPGKFPEFLQSKSA